jgi:transcriptional regulator with XRE-family HTH domain
MTGKDLKAARLRLSLSNSQLAALIGMRPVTVRRMEMDPSNAGHRTINPQVRRLVKAYLSGYRPPDWPDQPFYEKAA